MTRVSWPVHRRTRSASRAGPSEPPRPICNAPTTSLYLDPRGWVFPCVGSGLLLGNLAEERIADIWHGPLLGRLRRSVEQGDYGFGCAVCGPRWPGAEPLRGLAQLYDELEPLPGPRRPREVSLALGNTCNLRCRMCNGELSSSIRSQREHRPSIDDPYSPAVLADLVEFLAEVETLKFLGGEPFLVRNHHHVWDALHERGVAPRCQVTTNGTVWNASVERVLERFPVSISVSVDGIRPATVETMRVGASLATILPNLDRFQDYARSRGTWMSLTFCLSTITWAELMDFLLYADDRDLPAFVNQVRAPFDMAIERLPPEEVARILATLERDEADRGDLLGLNRPVWQEQLALIAEMVRTPRPESERSRPAPSSEPGPGPRSGEGAPWWPPGLVEELQAFAEPDGVSEAVVDADLRTWPTSRWSRGLPAPETIRGRQVDDAVRTLLEGLGSPGPLQDLGRWADAVQHACTLREADGTDREVRIVRTPVRVPGTGRGPSGLLVARGATPVRLDGQPVKVGG